MLVTLASLFLLHCPFHTSGTDVGAGESRDSRQIPAPPPFLPPPFAPLPSLLVNNAINSISQFDEQRCVPRLICEFSSGSMPGVYNGASNYYYRPPQSVSTFAGQEQLLQFLAALTLRNREASPLAHFGGAALLGLSSRGRPDHCYKAFPECPQSPDALLDYLNNHRGGFFRALQPLQAFTGQIGPVDRPPLRPLGPNYPRPPLRPGPYPGQNPPLRPGPQLDPNPLLRPGPQLGPNPLLRPGPPLGPNPFIGPSPQLGPNRPPRPGPHLGPNPLLGPRPQLGQNPPLGPILGPRPPFAPGAPTQPQQPLGFDQQLSPRPLGRREERCAEEQCSQEGEGEARIQTKPERLIGAINVVQPVYWRFPELSLQQNHKIFPQTQNSLVLKGTRKGRKEEAVNPFVVPTLFPDRTGTGDLRLDNSELFSGRPDLLSATRYGKVYFPKDLPRPGEVNTRIVVLFPGPVS